MSSVFCSGARGAEQSEHKEKERERNKQRHLKSSCVFLRAAKKPLSISAIILMRARRAHLNSRRSSYQSFFQRRGHYDDVHTPTRRVLLNKNF
jgi:hypothetical protein